MASVARYLYGEYVSVWCASVADRLPRMLRTRISALSNRSNGADDAADVGHYRG